MNRVTGALICISSLMLWGCRCSDEALAQELCAKADRLDASDPIQALRVRKQVWANLPTTGTAAAKVCGRKLRVRMGHARALVVQDKRGNAETITECEWAAHAVAIFAGCSHPPFRKRWARRLLERCINVVGRAWTRDPDSARLAHLTEMLKKYSAQDAYPRH